MKKLLNTLYVMSENGYLGLDGEITIVSPSNPKYPFMMEKKKLVRCHYTI